MTQRSADIWSGLFLSAVGIVVLVAAMGITGGMEERLPPRTLPYTMGFTVLAAGILLAVKSARSPVSGPTIAWPDRSGTKNVLVSLFSIAVYVLLIEPLGMPISTLLFIAFSVFYLWEGTVARRIVYGVLTGLISGFVVFYLFIYFLELSFPVGPLQK